MGHAISRQPKMPFLVLSIALTICASCNPSEETAPMPTNPAPEAFEGDFTIRLVSVQPGLEGQFIDFVRNCSVPQWKELRSNDIVSTINVFELSQSEPTVSDAQPWSFLLLAELGSQSSPDGPFPSNPDPACQQQPGGPLFTVLREESLSCTPNSCYSMPELSYADAESGIDYLIEFIRVEETPASLTKYRDLMSTYFGPANGLLVERGVLHCFVGLETTEVLSEIPGVPVWSQIHVSDHWDVNNELDWDAIYGDLFRNEFSREMDDVWSEVPHFPGPRLDFRGRLIPDLRVR